MNLLFDKNSLTYSRQGNSPLPFEVIVKNVSVDGLQKEIIYYEKQPKVTIELVDDQEIEKQLYYLPQQDKEIVTQVTKQIETVNAQNANGLDNEPIYITQIDKVPLYDDNNNPLQYEQMVRGKTIDPTDEPCMIQVEDAEGNVTEEQEKDIDGNLLYWGLVGTGNMITCYTTTETQVQKVNENNELLYLEEIVEDVVEYEKQPPLEITDSHEEYVEDGLNMVYEDVAKTRIANFQDEPHLFEYNDLIQHKSKTIASGFFSQSVLFEQFDNFTSIASDLGADFISLRPTGETQGIATLPKAATLIQVYTETNVDGLQIYVGVDEADLKLVDSNKERLFSSTISELHIKVVNPTDKRIDLQSLAVLV
jgi:hypothetical protein